MNTTMSNTGPRGRGRPRRGPRPAAEAARGAAAAGRSPTCRAPTTPQDWFAGRLPDGWFDGVDVTVGPRGDRSSSAPWPPTPATDAAEAEGRISRFRSETREQRIEIALEAEARYQRKVSWGASLGDTTALFTHVAAPVMTRLRQPERQVLDTLVDAGVARSRSDALAWSVRLVGEHADEWLGQLRDAMSEVDKLRGEGPTL